MQQENGLGEARFAQTNKEIGQGSEPEASSDELNIYEILQKAQTMKTENNEDKE